MGKSGKPISAQRVINEELEWQEVQIQLVKQLVDESSGGVMHSSIHDIKHRARRVIDAPEAPDAKPHWGLHEQALRTKGETTADRLPELMLRTARPQEIYHCRVITEDGSPTTVGLDHSSTDFRWMKVPAELEGFDPMAVNGRPTTGSPVIQSAGGKCTITQPFANRAARPCCSLPRWREND
jgi:hypothetical protein